MPYRLEIKMADGNGVTASRREYFEVRQIAKGFETQPGVMMRIIGPEGGVLEVWARDRRYTRRERWSWTRYLAKGKARYESWPPGREGGS